MPLKSLVPFILICFVFVCGCSTISTINKIEKIPFDHVSSDLAFTLQSSNGWKQEVSVTSPPVTYNSDSDIYQVTLNYTLENSGIFDSNVEIWASKDNNVFDTGKQIIKTKISALKSINSSITDEFLNSVHRQEIFYTGVKTDRGVIKASINYSLTGDYH